MLAICLDNQPRKSCFPFSWLWMDRSMAISNDKVALLIMIFYIINKLRLKVNFYPPCKVSSLWQATSCYGAIFFGNFIGNIATNLIDLITLKWFIIKIIKKRNFICENVLIGTNIKKFIVSYFIVFKILNILKVFFIFVAKKIKEAYSNLKHL